MDDFASFRPEGRQEENWAHEAERVLGSLQGKGDGELLSAIYARAVEGKKRGTLTNAQIDDFYQTVSPMLDGIKRIRLKKLVDDLKKL